MSILIAVGMFFSLRGIRGNPRSMVAGVACFALAAGMSLLRRAGRTKMRLSVTSRGVAWVHPEKGSGALYWKEIGALMVREPGNGTSTAVCLVPQDRPAEECFVLSTGDFGIGDEAGEARLREFVKQILPMLPSDLNIDRGTRKRLADWGIL